MPDFEHRGWDVVSRLRGQDDVFVEIKPALGDDFPAVLHQMKARIGRDLGPSQRYVLIIDRFAADGAMLDEVKTTFRLSRIGILTFAEIEEQKAPRSRKSSGKLGTLEN